MFQFVRTLFEHDVVVEFGAPSELELEARPFPDEEVAIARAVASRKQQYRATRALAHRAFERLGLGRRALVNHDDRSPLWPDGLVGSLTHTDAFCAVCVARSSEYRSLGIDAEGADRVTTDLFSRVLTQRERALVLSLPASEQRGLATLFFSAKESLYKCQFPLSRRFLGFEDVEIALDLDAGTFSSRILKQVPALPEPSGFDGRFVRDAQHVVTSCALRR